MGDVKWSLEGFPDIPCDFIQQVRAHQVYRHVIACNLFQHGVCRIEMSGVGSHQCLGVGFHGDLPDLSWRCVIERTDARLLAVFDEGFRKCAFMDEQIRILRQFGDVGAMTRVAANGDCLAFCCYAKTETFADVTRDMFDPKRFHFHVAVIEYDPLPDISAYGTVQGDCVREDFWLIVTARSGDETEIRERERSCRTVRS